VNEAENESNPHLPHYLTGELRQTKESIQPTVSVVMPSYQSAKTVRYALRALQAQQTSVPYEIIVVDSSTDGANQIIETEFPHVRLVHFPDRRQAGTARNVGVDAAKGEVILFLDTDTIPCATWIEQMYGAIRFGGADGVGGGMSNGTPGSLTGSAGFYLEFFRVLAHSGPPRRSRLLVSANSGFRRQILADARYADCSAGEDMLLSSRLARSGSRLFFLPEASVTHLNRQGWRSVLGYQRKLGLGAFLYRSEDSPEKVRPLRAAPPLIFLMPFAVMIWIGCSILRCRQVSDFLRFVAVLPLCFVANSVWAWGFYEAVRIAKRDACPA
jgi:glycosyltransferase involved in cell wall biosynthesis